MQGPTWLSLLRRLPSALHEGLIIVTLNGAEIVAQSIVRAERELLVIRGRMSGSQDTGRIIFVPFDQINYIALAKKPQEAEIQAVLAKPVPGGHAAEAAPAAAAAAAGVEEVDAFIPEAAHPAQVPPAEDEQNGTPSHAPAAPATPAKPAHPSKTVLLARLRARLAGDTPPRPSDAGKT
jgi:hypothetical protein